jgi:hypothetical protein
MLLEFDVVYYCLTSSKQCSYLWTLSITPQASNALICGPYRSHLKQAMLLFVNLIDHKRFEGEDFMKERIFTPSLTIERELTPMNRHDFPCTLKV